MTISRFQDWKNFVVMRYMRAELEVGTQEQELQQIAEAATKDEGDNGGNDLCDSSGHSVAEAIITEEERTQIQLTRNRLSAWFGV